MQLLYSCTFIIILSLLCAIWALAMCVYTEHNLIALRVFFRRDFVMDPSFFVKYIMILCISTLFGSFKELFHISNWASYIWLFLEDPYIISNLEETDGPDDRSLVS